MPFYTNKSKTLTHINRIKGEIISNLVFLIGFLAGMVRIRYDPLVRTHSDVVGIYAIGT